MEGPDRANEAIPRQREKSPLARYLDEAFAGCDTWTVAPGRRRAAAGALAPPEWVTPDPGTRPPGR